MVRKGYWQDIEKGNYFKADNPTYDFLYYAGLGFHANRFMKTDGTNIFSVVGARLAGAAAVGAKAGKMKFTIYDTEEDIPYGTEVLEVAKVNDKTGTDPEIFVVHGKVKKSLFPAFKFLLDQEKTPKPTCYDNYGYGNGSKGVAYRDGFAAEIGTTPIHCHAYLMDHVQTGLKAVLTAAKKVDPTAELTLKGTFPITKTNMAAGTDDEVALGCHPSFNAYNDNPQLPVDARKFRIRFAGGHIHFGGLAKYKDKLPAMVKACDVMAAIPGVAIFADVDSAARRQFYGRAGEYRTPAYGLEYRVLSNAWLATPGVAHLMMNLTRIGTKIGAGGYLKCMKMEESRARDIINNCDYVEARKWLKDKYDLFAKLLTYDGAGENAKAFKKIVEGGIADVLPDYENISKNWHLTDNVWQTHSGTKHATWGSLCATIAPQ